MLQAMLILGKLILLESDCAFPEATVAMQDFGGIGGLMAMAIEVS